MDGKWTSEEKTEIAKTLAIMAIIQKNYGREINVKDTVNAWEFVMSEYHAEQVVLAMQAYMRKSNDMPSPADLIKIISPPSAQITYAEYKHALEQHAAEGYPMFGYFGQVIKDYKNQQRIDTEIPTTQEILERRKEPLGIDVSKLLAATYGGNNE